MRDSGRRAEEVLRQTSGADGRETIETMRRNPDCESKDALGRPELSASPGRNGRYFAHSRRLRRRLKSMFTGHRRLRPWTGQLGGERDVQRSSLVLRASVFRISHGRAALTTTGITTQVRMTTTPAVTNPASTSLRKVRSQRWRKNRPHRACSRARPRARSARPFSSAAA